MGLVRARAQEKEGESKEERSQGSTGSEGRAAAKGSAVKGKRERDKEVPQLGKNRQKTVFDRSCGKKTDRLSLEK